MLFETNMQMGRRLLYYARSNRRTEEVVMARKVVAVRGKLVLFPLDTVRDAGAGWGICREEPALELAGAVGEERENRKRPRGRGGEERHFLTFNVRETWKYQPHVYHVPRPKYPVRSGRCRCRYYRHYRAVMGDEWTPTL
jgi:hypothetical protein